MQVSNSKIGSPITWLTLVNYCLFFVAYYLHFFAVGGATTNFSPYVELLGGVGVCWAPYYLVVHRHEIDFTVDIHAPRRADYPGTGALIFGYASAVILSIFFVAWINWLYQQLK